MFGKLNVLWQDSGGICTCMITSLMGFRRHIYRAQYCWLAFFFLEFEIEFEGLAGLFQFQSLLFSAKEWERAVSTVAALSGRDHEGLYLLWFVRIGSQVLLQQLISNLWPWIKKGKNDPQLLPTRLPLLTHICYGVMFRLGVFLGLLNFSLTEFFQISI